jgi:hypothetical protein
MSFPPLIFNKIKITSRYTRTARYRWHLSILRSCYSPSLLFVIRSAPLAGELIVNPTSNTGVFPALTETVFVVPVVED